MSAKVKAEHVGNYVRCYYSQDYGCMDAVLVEHAGDLCEVFFIGLRVKEIVETSNIVAVGPPLTAIVPRF
jgi:hypothetical protein